MHKQINFKMFCLEVQLEGALCKELCLSYSIKFSLKEKKEILKISCFTLNKGISLLAIQE